jgi:hypothetical protein
VRRCIYCDFGVSDTNLEDEKFQQVVYEGVLEKLEESLQHIEGRADSPNVSLNASSGTNDVRKQVELCMDPLSWLSRLEAYCRI